MSVATRLAALAARGVHLHLQEGELRYRGPVGALGEADKAALRAEKPAIVAYLQARQAAASPEAPPAPGEPLVPSLNQQVWWRLVHGAPQQLRMEKVPLVLPFRGADPMRAAAAVRALVARHAVLRARLAGPAETLRLSLNPPETFEVAVERVAGEAEAQARAAAFVQEPLPIDGDWLTRAVVLDVAGAAALVVLVCHHAVFDGSSMAIAAGELNDRLAGLEPMGPAPQFVDYARWERRWFEEGGAPALAAWWRAWLDALPVLRSPSGDDLRWRPGARVDHPLTFEPEVSRRIAGRAAELGSTPFVLILCAFGRALGAWSGQERFPIRAVGDLRTSQALSGAVGLLICHDPIEIDLRDSQTPAALAARVGAEYRSATALRLPPHPSGTGAGFEEFHERIGATVNYIPAGALAVETRGPALSLPIPPNRAQTLPWPSPLPTVFLRLWEAEGGLDGRLEFNEGVVGPAEQAALVAAFGAAIEAIAG